MPVLVYGYEAGGAAHLADRARVPLVVDADELHAARGRVGSNKYRIAVLPAPDLSRLPQAVEAGIRACIRLYDGEPPRGPGSKFGFGAYKTWADLLVNETTAQGWGKMFPRGSRLYSGLSTAFNYISYWGIDPCGGRGVYADFLDEASAILNRPALKDAAAQFRTAAGLWQALTTALLPDDVPPFKQARELMLRRQALFIDQGGESREERNRIRLQLDTLKSDVSANFPLDDAGVKALKLALREHILRVHDAEQEAVNALRAAVG